MFDKNNIKVYNYSGSMVSARTKNREVSFLGAQDGVPTMEPMTFDELEYINSNCNLLRNGRLEFDEDERDEIYAALNIDANECLFERDIDNLLVDYTETNVLRIIGIKEEGTFERVRGHLIYHKNRRDLDVSTRMVELINKRYKELLKGIRQSRILVKPAQQTAQVTADMLEQMKQEAIAEALKVMQQQTTPAQSVEAVTNSVEPETAPVEAPVKVEPKATTTKKTTTTSKPKSTNTTAKKRGRPAGTTKAKTATK